MFGSVEILVVYLLLALDSPLAAWANRAAESWPGRFALAALGWLLISVVMIVVLSVTEARAKRQHGAPPPASGE